MSDAPIYAIGDIHGQAAELERALDLIAADGGGEAEIVFLGDLVDRGPDSRGVIDRLLAGQDAGLNWRVIKGNHDRMFCRFVTRGEQHDSQIMSGLSWMNPRLGGPATLASYGIEDADARPLSEVHAQALSSVPERHLAFLEGGALWHRHGPVLFVHAGVRPGVALQDQVEDDLLWIRGPFLTYAEPHPWLVVHGHTALELPQHFGNRIDLDGGAGYGRALHPAVMQDGAWWLLSDRGRVPLEP